MTPGRWRTADSAFRSTSFTTGLTSGAGSDASREFHRFAWSLQRGPSLLLMALGLEKRTYCARSECASGTHSSEVTISLYSVCYVINRPKDIQF